MSPKPRSTWGGAGIRTHVHPTRAGTPVHRCYAACVDTGGTDGASETGVAAQRIYPPLLTLVMPGGQNAQENDQIPAPATSGTSTLRNAAQCTGEYAECPDGDRRCILEAGHGETPSRWRRVGAGLHMNRAGFAWDDREAAESALRVIAQLRAELASLRAAAPR